MAGFCFLKRYRQTKFRGGIRRSSLLSLGVTCGLLGFVPSSAAVSFLSFDPRSMAMGGAGVASARSYNATIFNPALLVSSQSSDDWKFYFRPYLGARLLDRDNFLDALDEYQDSNSEDEFDRLLEIAKRDFAAGLITADDLRALAAAAEDWQGDIDKLSDKPLRASLSYGFTIGAILCWALESISPRSIAFGYRKP